MAYQSQFGYIEPEGLQSVDPSSPNHIVVYTGAPESEVSNGPSPEYPVKLSNPLQMNLATAAPSGIAIENANGATLSLGETVLSNATDPLSVATDAGTLVRVSEPGVLQATSEVRGTSFGLMDGANPSLPLSSPGPTSIWLGPGTEPDLAQRILYLGDNPVDTDAMGIVADDPQAEHVMLFKDNQGDFAYPGAGGQTEAYLGQSLAIGGYFKVGGKDTIIPGAEAGNLIYADGTATQDRIHAGNFPIIRSKATAGAFSGGGLPVGKLAVFANSPGDLMPQLEKQAMDPEDPGYDPEYPNDVETTEMEGPLEITNPNQNPDTPALKVCQDSPEPTTLDLCNENPAGGSQIVFSGPPGNEPSIQSIPADGATPAGIAVAVPVVGAAPVAAIAVPPVLAAGVAGALPVAAAAAAAAGAGGAAAGIAAAAGALAGAAAGAAAVVGIAGIVAAPVVALTGVIGGLPTMPKGAITLDPLSLDILNGDIPLVGWKPNVSLPEGQSIPTTKDGEIPTTKDGEIPSSPDPLGPSDPKTVGEPDPTKPATVKVPELIVESPTSPTTLTLAGPCAKEGQLKWDCTTGTLQVVIHDAAGPTDTVVQQWTETNTTINNLAAEADYLTLAAQPSNPGGASTIYLDSADTTHPKFGSEYLALASDIAGAGLTTDTNPIANELTVYADVSGNRKTADAPVTLGKSLTLTGGVNTKPQANTTADMVRLVPGTETQSGIMGMQALTGALLGYSYLGWNGYYSTGEQRFNTSKNRWRVGVDQRSSTDTFFVDTWNGSGGSTSILSADANSGYMSINRGLTLNLPSSLSNPINAYGLSAGRMRFSFINGNAGIHRSSIQIGGNANAQRWSFGNDYLEDNTDDSVFIRRDDTVPVYALQASSAGFVTLPNGFQSARHDLISAASNPGGANTLWLDSADTTRPKLGGAALALSSDLKTDTNPVANELVLFSDASGNKKSNGASSVATLGGYGLQTKDIHLTPGVADPSLTASTLYANSGGALKYGSSTVAMTSDVNALKSNFTLTAQASNPGGATTLWALSTGGGGLMYGDEGLLTATSLVAVMGLAAWSGNWTLHSDRALGGDQTVAVQLDKVRRQVALYVSAITFNNTAADPEVDPPSLIHLIPPVDSDLDTMLPIDGAVCTGLNMRLDAGPTIGLCWKYDSANRRFTLCNYLGLNTLFANETLYGSPGFMNYMTS